MLLLKALNVFLEAQGVVALSTAMLPSPRTFLIRWRSGSPDAMSSFVSLIASRDSRLGVGYSSVGNALLAYDLTVERA